jgi:hypothetical protein
MVKVNFISASTNKARVENNTHKKMASTKNSVHHSLVSLNVVDNWLIYPAEKH